MSNWISGKELIAYWGIKGFELFDFLKKGLQPYTPLGQKIVDTDTLEHARAQPLEFFEGTIRHIQNMHVVGSERHSHRLTEWEIGQQAQKDYESQPLEPVNPPPHHMSFTLPLDAKKASEALFELNFLLFRKDNSDEFAEKHGLRQLDDYGVDQVPDVGSKDDNQPAAENKSAQSRSRKDCGDQKNQVDESITPDFLKVPDTVSPGPKEKPIVGWKKISETLGWSESKAKKKKEKLKKAAVIFYELTGRPPKRRPTAWPSTIKYFTEHQGK